MRALMGVVLFFVVVLAVLGVVSHVGAKRIQAELPPVGEFITVDGLRLHYLQAGKGNPGPPIVLLHGASSNLRDFQASILPVLAKTHHVIAFDRPGMGYSQRRKAWLNPGDLCDLMLNAAAELGADKPVVVGHSWSGSVVMACALDQPQRIAGGVLLAGAAGHWTGGVDWNVSLARVPLLGQLFTRTLIYPLGQALLPGVVRYIMAPNPPPGDYIDNIGAKLALRPAAYRSNAQDLTRLSEFLQLQSARYPDVQSRLLIIHGEADTVVPYWNHGQRVKAVVPDAQVELLPGVGHVPHHVDPETIATLIADFAN